MLAQSWLVLSVGPECDVAAKLLSCLINGIYFYPTRTSVNDGPPACGYPHVALSAACMQPSGDVAYTWRAHNLKVRNIGRRCGPVISYWWMCNTKEPTQKGSVGWNSPLWLKLFDALITSSSVGSFASAWLTR